MKRFTVAAISCLTEFHLAGFLVTMEVEVHHMQDVSLFCLGSRTSTHLPLPFVCNNKATDLLYY